MVRCFPAALGTGTIAGLAATVTELTPTKSTLPEVAESAGVALSAAVAWKFVPAPGGGVPTGVGVERMVAPRRPRGTMVTPAGGPTSVQVSAPLPAATAVRLTLLPEPSSAGAFTAVTVGAGCTAAVVAERPRRGAPPDCWATWASSWSSRCRFAVDSISPTCGATAICCPAVMALAPACRTRSSSGWMRTRPKSLP